MGILSSILGVFGFGIGTSVGIVIGYYMFIYFLHTDVKDPKIHPLVEEDSKTLQKMLPEIPLWVKIPDFDRVCSSMLCHFCISGPKLCTKAITDCFSQG
ncbi:hypothetical protein F3Y22_tig00112042pilonHSYRG00048 [Hibiscus syriacus]|uniref:Uncharacterized protein n=1 Tax=Hibiscus syriacus TaxID=106335 RepID=A0A6A2XVY9_HIBSY|nr:hypothetical protein F3Y22_tig00112042pilonHSYRG00048 [Hibiscus syriacus]